MSMQFLRHSTLNHTVCLTCIRVPRFYSAQAVLRSLPRETEASKGSTSQVIDSGTASSSQDIPAKVKNTRKPKKLQPSTEEDAPRRSALDPTGVELYLASIHAAGLEPHLSDLERCRPRRHPHMTSPTYAQEYNALVDTLCRSFSKDQLRKFLEMYDVDPVWYRSTRRKAEYAETIIEKQWKWPCLKEIERSKRDRTEVSIHSFPVNVHQLFLILGQDGVNLLHLSKEFNVHISLTPDPLALQVEGLRGALKKLTERMSNLKRDIVEETIQLPTHAPIRADLVQRISRLAGAFVENIGYKGKVKIYAKDARSLANAKRLATRAAHEVEMSSRIPQLSYFPAGSDNRPSSLSPQAYAHAYSLYPFLSPRSLPWTMNTAGAFRLRKVGEWLGQSISEDVQKTGGLSGGQGQISTIAQTKVDLKQALFDELPDLHPDTRRIVKASFGHMLFTIPSSGQRATLLPPLKGYHPSAKILNWMESNGTRTSFVTSLPSSLVDASPSKQKILHRLVYQALPSPSLSSDSLSTADTVTFEVVLAQPKKTSTSEESTSESSADDTVLPDLGPRCWAGQEKSVDLMMPDRAMDMRLSVVDLTHIPEGQEPAALQIYMNDLHNFLGGQNASAVQPDCPLLIEYNQRTYILHLSASVRQSTEETKSLDEDSSTHLPIAVVSESMLDLESNQKSTQCEIVCDDTSDGGWQRFLRNCDRLSSAVYRPTNIPTLGNIDEGI